MRNFFIVLFMAVCHSVTGSPQMADRCMAYGYVLQDKNVAADSVLVETLLQDAAVLPETENLPLYFARKFLGTPYVGHTLDRKDMESLVINLRELDCTTLVENVVALTRCVRDGKTTFADFVNMLGQIRYRGGVLSYENRLHYYQWWVDDNGVMGFVREKSSPDPPFCAVRTLKINYMSENPGSYDMLKNHPERIMALKVIEDKTNGTKVRYIPKSQVADTELLRKTVHDGDIIAIVTNKRNLDTTHLGFAVWHEDGLHLLNASSIHHKVVEEPMTLYQYLHRNNNRIGIRIAEIL